MTLKVKFGGPLVRFKPESAIGNTAIIENVAGLTLTDLLKTFGIPEDQRLLTILNGSVIPVETYSVTLLSENDDLSLMPPIQAG